LFSFRKVKGKKSNPYPIELKKTGVSLVFMLLNFCATTISLALTHERIPDKEPLPDFLLDNVQNRSWGLTASEIVLQVCM
jgi:shingomyelin synthase